MKVAHIILTHKNPEQVKRLIDNLNHPAFDFFIHVDSKADITSFEKLLKNNRTYFIKKRASIHWAGFGTIQATINSFKEILTLDYNYINVISGQDFPVQNANTLYNYLLSKKGKEFITCERIADEWPDAKPRVEKYHLINWQIPGKFKLEKIINTVLPKRKFPLPYEIVGRANWFTITKNAALHILEELEKHPEIIRFFKYSWGADELIFSSILYNSNFKPNIEPNLVYVDWSAGGGHPKILGVEDYNNIISSGKFFARKFDIEKDAAIIDMLQKKIQR